MKLLRDKMDMVSYTNEMDEYLKQDNVIDYDNEVIELEYNK